MTKTTNYEISKKLKEIGFDKETNFYFTEVAPDKFEAQYYTNNKEYLLLKSYELETLLDALPSSIEYKNEYNVILNYDFFLQNDKLGYYYEHGEYRNDYHMGDGIFEFSKLSLDESLADTAGRLIIELYEKNLIKF